MSLFHKESHDEWRHKRSQEQLALGGLPLNAESRLRGLENNPRLFTSTLSVNEFVLAKSDGLKPCGSVTGTSVFHTGMQTNPVYTSTEMHSLSNAQIQGRKLAIGRMLLEAKRLNAHEVMGVRLIENAHDWDRQGMEFTAIGTAVQRTGWRSAAMLSAAMLTPNTLTGQELAALQQAGYYPVGIALGVCVYYQVASPFTTQVIQGGAFNSASRINQEVTEYTCGLTEAQRHAVRYMENEAASQYSEGVVDVQLSKTMEIKEVELEMYEHKLKRRDLLVTVFIVGTMIRSVDTPLPKITANLPLVNK